MRNILAGLILFLASLGPALAQRAYPPANTINCAFNTSPPTVTTGQMVMVQCDSGGRLILSSAGGGSSIPGAGSQPYNYTPLTPGQYGLAITTATALTIPTGALQAVVCAAGNNVNYTYDGTTTPTASVGLPLATGQCIQFSGAAILANLKFIQTAATATLNVGYTQ